MRKSLGLLVVVIAAGSPGNAGNAPPNPLPAQRPFFEARKQQAVYAGPGRETPPPEDIGEVLIGYFGPSDPSDPDGGDMWFGAQLAVEKANERGGYQGKPFRLVPAWSANPWGSGVSQVTRLVYDYKVWAIIGGIDGPSTHLAEQVVAKARLALISPGSTDKTVNLTNIPWMFSCLPDDHLTAAPLAAEIEARAGSKPLVLVSATDHDSRLSAEELRKCLAARRLAPAYHFQWNPESTDIDALVTRILEARTAAVILVASARESARLLAALRKRAYPGLVFGGPSMGRRAFLQMCGPAAEGAIFPVLYTPGEQSKHFKREFSSRTGHAPDYTAAYAYDAVDLLVAAIQKAGLNRARIGDAVRNLSGWEGATGRIQWDSVGANRRAVNLGTIRNGRVDLLRAPNGKFVASERLLRTPLDKRQ